MDISVPSRFSCLKLVEDDFGGSKKTEKKREKPNNKNKVEKPINKDNNKKIPSNNKNNNKREKKMKVMSDKQWEEWKQKDDEFVNGNFQQDLQSAILLSKLEYESKKDTVKKTEKEGEKKNDKKKKTKTMSLDEFLGANEQKQKENEVKVEKIEKDENFFERVKLEAKEVYTKDKINENRKNRQANIEEIISSAQYQEKLLLERQKNLELKEELEKLKSEIADVKSRNKKLCGILGHGEMKDKADVLLELERLNTVKNELTEEVAKLHALLEQERSKVAALTAESQKVKDKKHKKHT